MAQPNIFEIGAELAPETKAEINHAFSLLLDGYQALKKSLARLNETPYVQAQTREQIADRFDAVANLIGPQLKALQDWAATEPTSAAEEDEEES